MTEYKSLFGPQIEKYMEFRIATGFSNHQEKLLKRFDRYCAEYHPSAEVLSQRIARGWIEYEAVHGFTGLDSKASALRGLAMFIGENAYVLSANLIPKRPHFVPYILTDEELSRLFDAIDCYHHPFDPFFSETARVLFRLIYACGLRPNEGRNLSCSDINFETGELFITKTKRRKERIVVASDEMLSLMIDYRYKRILFGSDSDAFFVHNDGRPISAGELTRCILRCWKNANPLISDKDLPRIRVYDLRHRFASANLQRWLDEGKDLYAMLPYLRAYMGHEKFEDTAYYIHILPDRLLKSPGVDWESIDKIGLEVDLWKN